MKMTRAQHAVVAKQGQMDRLDGCGNGILASIGELLPAGAHTAGTGR